MILTNNLFINFCLLCISQYNESLLQRQKFQENCMSKIIIF